jgi:hypothetical protein
MATAVQKLRDKHNKIKADMYSVNRRFTTLQEHLNRVEIYDKNKAVYRKWCNLKGDKADAYYKKHSDEISDWTEAHKYFRRILGVHKQIPLADWEKEYADASIKRSVLYNEQNSLSKEIKSGETIKRNAEAVLSVQRRQRDIEIDR